jgi:peptidyl-prolyl cis-trans isomerase B (cyclophilin B)
MELNMKKYKIISLILVICLIISLSGCKKDESSSSSTNSKTSSTNSGDTTSKINFDVNEQFDKPVKGEEYAVVKTSMGTFKMRLFAADAINCVTAFTSIVKQGYYTNNIFYGAYKNNMVMTGDKTGTGTGGKTDWEKPFGVEYAPYRLHYRGAVSMIAKSKELVTSQLLISVGKTITKDQIDKMRKASYPKEVVDKYEEIGGTPWHDLQYPVIGQVFEGMDVVDKISNVNVDKSNKPVKQVKIITIKLVKMK